MIIQANLLPYMFFFLSESEKSQHLLFCRVSMAQGIVQQFGLGEMACTICGDKVVATPPKVRQVMANYYQTWGTLQ